MLSIKSIKSLYDSKHALKSHSNVTVSKSKVAYPNDGQHLSREQVLEIYDWVAQLKTQQSNI